MALERHRYSRNLVEVGGDPFLQLQSHKGGFLVVDHGEAIGSIKKLKAGWTMSPTWAAGRQKETLERAMALVDGHVGDLP